MNPSLVANAAIKSTHDERDFLYSDVARGAAPFDWSVGYDGKEDLEMSLGHPVTIPIKDQDGSGSCGGQAESYGGASLSAFHDTIYEEKSAKFTYAPVAVRPGGGSSGRDLANRAIKFGWGSETLTSSYENGQPPSEAFMERTEDITGTAVMYAAKDKALNYTLLPIDIDFIAQAIRDWKFARLGVVGSNNGTWGSADPVPPIDGQPLWYHWVCGLKAKMRNGKKAIGFPNSWGTATGDHGWQWLNEDWFKAHLSNSPYGVIPIFEPRCYTWNPQPAPPSWHHTFSVPLVYNQTDPEVINLQTALRLDGEFPAGVPYNTHYGNVTRQAVLAFQLKYQLDTPAVLLALQGKSVGPKTRAKLNQLFS